MYTFMQVSRHHLPCISNCILCLCRVVGPACGALGGHGVSVCVGICGEQEIVVRYVGTPRRKEQDVTEPYVTGP